MGQNSFWRHQSSTPMIERENDVIHINGLNKAKAVSQFLKAIKYKLMVVTFWALAMC